MRERLLELVRFCTVGLVCLGVALGVLAGLHELLGLNYLLAYIASFVVGNVCGYLLNARFTFSAQSVDHAGALRYMTVNGVLLFANTAALKLLVDVLHLWYFGAAVLLAAINAPVTFFAQRLITYGLSSRGRAVSS